MGYMLHHAIVVTGCLVEAIDRAHKEAIRLQGKWNVVGEGEDLVSPISTSHVSGFMSFCIFPDGSNEGWELSDSGDKFRQAFIEWLDEQRYEDGSSPVDWVEVQFGDENKMTKVCRDSDHR